jgi:hypothetical protein
MTSPRWTLHALNDLLAREISREEAERTVLAPDRTVPGSDGRTVLMRRYFDHILKQDMLLRVVVEYDGLTAVIITVYKTSKVSKYLGIQP